MSLIENVEQAEVVYSPDMFELGERWKNSRGANHLRDVSFLFLFLASIAPVLYMFEFLRRRFPDRVQLWDVLGNIDDLFTVIIFVLFWKAIVVRIWYEGRVKK